MRSLLGTLCALSVFAATGYSLSCQTCMSAGSTPCQGQSLPCPPDSACVATYTLTTTNGVTVSEAYTLSCAPLGRCDKPGSFSFPKSKLKMGTSCCYTDNCSPPTPTLPADNNQVNGLVCPTCASADSAWCYTSDTMQCTGDENMCLLQTTEIKVSSKVAVRGCATKSICDLGSTSVSYPGYSMDVKFSCTSGSFGTLCYYLSPLL
ncbi:phospholipase A2 inhibitor and Ly6/PLAUR domain-containing protein-like [Xenopus tropicalis]|uniref:Phospholipase A2 inhibitor and Ly6/PLAUR domain-containing protein-like n=1 Tax=Xenopus tropicalis TaxID=8364 RepID=A0A803J8T9_XENTR|nr:phospholipase A2 inhibitor and Ly6/PLAUR domain-containing protein-like [Xenopus tropicalis]